MEYINPLKQIFENKLFRKFLWSIKIIYLLIGIAFIFYSFSVNSLLLRIILLYIGSITVSSEILGVLNLYLYFKIPRKYIKRISFSLGAWLVLGLYFIPNGIFRWFTIGGPSLVFFLLPTLSGILWLFHNRFLPWSLHNDYVRGFKGTNYSHMGYALFETGRGARYGHRIMRELRTAVSTYGGENIFLFFLSKSFKQYPHEFEKMVISHTPAIVISIDSSKNQNPEFEEKIKDVIKLSTGKIYFIIVTSLLEKFPPTVIGKGIEKFSFTSLNQETDQTEVADFVSRIVDQSSRVHISLGESDANLDFKIKKVVQTIANRGLPPISNCYLRFRLSQSDVERYMSLLECIEVLIKISTIYLLTHQWRIAKPSDSELAEISKKIKRPALGDWIYLLNKFISSSYDCCFKGYISDAWQKPVNEAQQRVINDTKIFGLVRQGNPPSNNLEWLDWLRWLRNATRGHGTVEENQVSILWHSLHESFLCMVNDLDALSIDSFLTTDPKLNENSMRGWTREIDNNIGDDESNCKPFKQVFIVNKQVDFDCEVSLWPFVTKTSDSFLIWNSMNGGNVEFIDNSSGRLIRKGINSNNLYEIWNHNEGLL